MNDDQRLACARLREAGAELALGILPARERAAAVAHLQNCPACRDHVRELAQTADGLAGLIPGREPPVGFEARVMERLGVRPRGNDRPPPTRWRRWRRLVLTTAAAATAFALGLGGWALGDSVTDRAPAAPAVPATVPAPVPKPANTLLTADLTTTGTSSGQYIGQAFAFTGPAPWVYMSVDAEGLTAQGTVRCQIRRADGSTATVGHFTLTDGYAQWGGPYPASSSPVTGARLLAQDGSIMASATFGAAAR
jgi:hypothetical protein